MKMSSAFKNGSHVPTVAVHVSCKCSDVRSGPGGGGGASCDGGAADCFIATSPPPLADAHTLLTSGQRRPIL